MNLRWIERNGEKVLQQLKWIKSVDRGVNDPLFEGIATEWITIPIHEDNPVEKLREWWIKDNQVVAYYNDSIGVISTRRNCMKDSIHVTELKPGSRVVSREMIKKALHSVYYRTLYGTNYTATGEQRVLELLGFGDADE